LSGYMTLALSLSRNSELHGESFNFGPQSQQDFSVLDLVNEMSDYWDSASQIEISDSSNEKYEAGLLKLNCDKAVHILKWYGSLDYFQCVEFTSKWYVHFYHGSVDMHGFTVDQISEYELIAKNRGLLWSQ